MYIHEGAMNTIICMQSPIITLLARKIDEHLSMSDSPVTSESRSQFLTRVMRIDFTTLSPIRGIEALAEDRELLNAYLDFSNAVIDSWDQPPSICNIVVLHVDGVNAKVAVELY